MIINTIRDEKKKIKCDDMFIDMLSIFMDTRYEEYVGDDEENISAKQIICGIKKYVDAQKDYFRGYELLFDINDISDLLDNALIAIATSHDC